MQNKLNMRKKAQEFYGYEIDFEKMFPTFEKEQAIDTVTRWLQSEFSSDQIQNLIVKNKLYDYIYYTFIGMYSHLVHKGKLSKNVLKQLALEMAHKWEVEGSPLSISPDIKELTNIDPALQKLLNKYTADEIFDIASGRKEAIEEEIQMAKDVITRGIVSNRLSMRKKARDREREELANKSSNPEILAELAKDKDEWVRMSVVNNPNTPLEILAELAKDEDEDIRWGVAGNVNTSPETLAELAKDEDEGVRWNVAWNKYTPPETLAELAKDEDETIRYNVAANPNTSPETLARLVKDKDEYVSYKAVENPNAPKKTIPKFEQHITDLFDQVLMEREVEFPPEFLEELEIEPETVVPPQPPLTKELIISKVLELLAKERGISKVDKRTEFKAMKILRKIFREQEIELAEEAGEAPPSPISEVEEQEELTEEKVDVPYADLLNKYTEDEIFDIASGRKEATEEEVEQAKEVITRGIVSNRLSMRKFSQSTPETIQKAQAGDENAIAQVIEENTGLISQALINWGHTPESDEFQDVMSDIKVEMLNRIIPQYDSSKGAFSTFLSTAVYNFLRRGTREKEYKEKQKEVSLAEPVEEGITLEDTLEDKTSEVVQMTLSSARENLQNWLHMQKPELEEVVLRIFDLKVEEYSHERIAEALNQERYTSKGKSFTRTMVNNYVNDWIKPALAQYFEAFKTASLNMRKKAGTAPLSYKKVMDLVMIVKDLQQIIQEVLGLEELEKLDRKLYNIFGDNIVSEKILEIDAERDVTANDVIQIIGEYLAALDTSELGYSAREILESLIKVCQDPDNPKQQIKKVPLKDVFKTEEEDEEEEKEEWKAEKKPLKVDRELTEEKVDVPYANLLNKYSPDEIFDIASGRKEATEEEVEQAKDVITRGIVSNRLNMRKKSNE